jgi:hypothetical protein
MIVGELALLVAALFTGAALHAAASEQPARLLLDDRAMLLEWQESYARARLMQGALALIGFVLAGLAYVLTGDARWLIGGLALLANWPWTLLAMRSVNRDLSALDPDSPAPWTRSEVRRWGRLHLVRAGLGLLSSLIFIWAMN